MKKTPIDLALLNRTVQNPFCTTKELGWILAFLETCLELEPSMAPKDDDRAKWLEGIGIVRASIAGRSIAEGPRHGAPLNRLTGDLFRELQAIAEKSWVGPAAVQCQLPFVQDPLLRSIAERDLTSLEAFRKADEVKASLILSGSAMEAILLDALQQDMAATISAAQAVKTKRQLSNPSWGSFQPKNPDTWTLHHMIAVCGPDGRQILVERTERCASAVRDYRNLVHPREEVKEIEKSPLLTSEAAVAVGLMEQVIEQVKNWQVGKLRKSGA